jgi:hypothetical protein
VDAYEDTSTLSPRYRSSWQQLLLLDSMTLRTTRFETLNNVSRAKVQTMRKFSKVLAFALIVAAVAQAARAQNATTTTQMRLEHAEVPL